MLKICFSYGIFETSTKFPNLGVVNICLDLIGQKAFFRPLGSRLWCLQWVCHFHIGILGQVWYLIVSIPDLCTLSCFYLINGAVVVRFSQWNWFKCPKTYVLIKYTSFTPFWAPSLTIDWINPTCLFSKLLAISPMPKIYFDDICMLHIYKLGIFD